MLSVSQECRYTLRAISELDKRYDRGLTTVAEIAKTQPIPPRFPKLIDGQLRRGNFVQSWPGVQGGYFLAVAAGALRVGDIIRFIDGPMAPVRRIVGSDCWDCWFSGHCAFAGAWWWAQDAKAGVYGRTTFQGLLDAEAAARGKHVASRCI